MINKEVLRFRARWILPSFLEPRVPYPAMVRDNIQYVVHTLSMKRLR